MELKEGAVVELPVSFAQSQLQDFATFSGDANPMHLDAEFARARGFTGCVVHGALIISAVSRLLGTELPGPGCVWHSLSIQFKAPLYAGEKARLIARVTYVKPEWNLCRMDLQILRGEEVLAKGQAQAELRLAKA